MARAPYGSRTNVGRNTAGGSFDGCPMYRRQFLGRSGGPRAHGPGGAPEGAEGRQQPSSGGAKGLYGLLTAQSLRPRTQLPSETRCEG